MMNDAVAGNSVGTEIPIPGLGDSIARDGTVSDSRLETTILNKNLKPITIEEISAENTVVKEIKVSACVNPVNNSECITVTTENSLRSEKAPVEIKNCDDNLCVTVDLAEQTHIRNNDNHLARNVSIVAVNDFVSPEVNLEISRIEENFGSNGKQSTENDSKSEVGTTLKNSCDNNELLPGSVGNQPVPEKSTEIVMSVQEVTTGAKETPFPIVPDNNTSKEQSQMVIDDPPNNLQPAPVDLVINLEMTPLTVIYSTIPSGTVVDNETTLLKIPENESNQVDINVLKDETQKLENGADSKVESMDVVDDISTEKNEQATVISDDISTEKNEQATVISDVSVELAINKTDDGITTEKIEIVSSNNDQPCVVGIPSVVSESVVINADEHKELVSNTEEVPEGISRNADEAVVIDNEANSLHDETVSEDKTAIVEVASDDEVSSEQIDLTIDENESQECSLDIKHTPTIIMEDNFRIDNQSTETDTEKTVDSVVISEDSALNSKPFANDAGSLGVTSIVEELSEDTENSYNDENEKKECTVLIDEDSSAVSNESTNGDGRIGDTETFGGHEIVDAETRDSVAVEVKFEEKTINNKEADMPSLDQNVSGEDEIMHLTLEEEALCADQSVTTNSINFADEVKMDSSSSSLNMSEDIQSTTQSENSVTIPELESSTTSGDSKSSEPNKCDVSPRPDEISSDVTSHDVSDRASDLMSGRRAEKARPVSNLPHRKLSARKGLKSAGGAVVPAIKLTSRSSKKVNVELGSKPSNHKMGTRSSQIAKISTTSSSKEIENEELLAKISSTLREDVKSHESNFSSLSKVNGTVGEKSEQKLDNETLLAILEGRGEVSEACIPDKTATTTSATTNLVIPDKVDVVASVLQSTQGVRGRKESAVNSRGVKRLRKMLDPEVEKQLALKQLRDFESKKSRRATPATSSAEPIHNNRNGKEMESKKGKKKSIDNFSSTPKELTKVCERVSGRQDRVSKTTLKTSTSEPRRIHGVGDVETAIDKYIKTYANKRRLMSENSSSVLEAPVQKKARIVNANVSPKPANPRETKEVQPEQRMADENRNDIDMNDQESRKNEEMVTKTKANSKVMREINRLLGDEGAINMIYSVERKRLSDSVRDTNYLPSTRRKKKDLLLKTKLVKNAVLRLSMTTSQATASRGRRSSPDATVFTGKSSLSPSRKTSIESADSNTSEVSSPRPVHQAAAEESIIIRRHSSSSAFSSDEDQSTTNKEPIEGKMPSDSVKVVEVTVATEKTQKEQVLHNVTPDIEGAANRVQLIATASAKTVKAANVVEKTPGEAKIASESPVLTGKTKAKRGRKSLKRSSNVTPTVPDLELDKFEEITKNEIIIRKYDNLVQVVLLPSSSQMKGALNVEMLRELTILLNELQNDDKCRIVLVTSKGTSFCTGVDLQLLICSDASERNKIVTEYVNAVIEFAKSLSRFKKLLVAGINGAAIGLGVTMLPFFDMVYASDKATFYTPYVKLGQIPEAGATLTLPHLLGNAVTSELLFGCRILTASEALQFGLVTKTLKPDKFNEELLPLANGIISHSSQSLVATKELMRKTMNERLQSQFELEAKYLQEHWCSEECQTRIQTYIREEIN